jgi:hypothetical protein
MISIIDILRAVRRQWLAALVLFIVLCTGTAYAAAGSNTIFSDDIVDGQVTLADIGTSAVASDEIANDSVLDADIATNSLTSARVRNGTLTGVDVADNSLKGSDIDESTLDIAGGARAYARLQAAACSLVTGQCDPEQSKGVTSITRTDTGDYCVAVPAVNSATVPAAVTVEFNGTADPEGNASAMIDERFGCGADGKGFRVHTDRQPRITVDADGKTNNAFVTGQARVANDVSFTIVVP